MSSFLLFRDIQKEIQAYLIANGFDNRNIYIDPSEAPIEPWIYVEYLETTGLAFYNNISINHNMTLAVVAQIYNSQNTSTTMTESGDYMYQDMNNLYQALEDWFCRTDIVTYPLSKKVSGSKIKMKKIEIKNIETAQVKRAMMFEIKFNYSE